MDRYSGYTIWFFNSLPWKIPKIYGGYGLVRWENDLFLWAMASMAMSNNQSICLSMNLPRRMMIYFILSVTYRIIEYVHPSYKHVTIHSHIPIALLQYTRYTYRCTHGLPIVHAISSVKHQMYSSITHYYTILHVS